MGVLVVERRGKFWISVNHKKKRLVRCLGAGKQAKKAAEQAAVQIAARLAQGDLSVLEKQAPPAIGPTFGEMAKAWPAWQQGRFPVRPATERIRESFLRVHLIPAFGTKPIAEITRMAVGDFIAAKRAGGMADSTIAVGLVTLSLILSFAVERSDIPSNPLKSGVRLWKPATRPGPDPFTREERDALVLAADVIDTRWGLMVASWAATGMRSGEIRGLEVSDVNGGAIRVGRTYTFKASGPPKTPRGTRTVPMPAALLAAVLGAAVGATGPLFPSLQHPGERMNEKELHRLWRRTVKAAGVRYRAAENLRHTRISIGLSDGEPLLKISADFERRQARRPARRAADEVRAGHQPQGRQGPPPDDPAVGAGLGYVEGKSIVFEYRFAEDKYDRLPGLAAELVRSKVDVIVAHASPGTRAAKEVTSTIPIVMAGVGDPVGTGFVASLARPGGNATGVSNNDVGLAAKRLGLLKELLPKLSRVAVLRNPANPASELQSRETQGAARSLGIETQLFDVRDPKELESAFSVMAKARAGALTVISDPMFLSRQKQVAHLAVTKRLPSIFARNENVQAGGLMSYGPTLADTFRQAATYVGKILKGAKPGDLPVEEPTRMYLVINLKTAKALGLTIPPSLLARADEVIH